MVRILQWEKSKYFYEIHLCMFPGKRGARWKRRQSNVFSLDINKE
jgi:hypothetical protein